MMDFLFTIITAFTLGFLTPITAVCVLPLYPGFLSYLANQLTNKDSKSKVLLLGILVSSGVISFMIFLGLVFTTLLEVSLTNVIGIITPIAFIILIIISIFLILNIELTSLFPKITPPTSNNPKISAFLYGFFFGTIIIPCNPALIAAFFTRSLQITSFVENMISFIFFGIGIAFPLFFLSILSLASGKRMISFLLKYKKLINVFSGLIMLIISIYYLVFIFKIFS